MKVSIDSALNVLGPRFQNIDFYGIQRIIDTFDDPKIAAAANADPNNFMINEMKKHGMDVPEGLHFHRRIGDVLVPPEPSDCVPPQVSLVLSAAPHKDLELEQFRVGAGGTATPASGSGACSSCFICVCW